MFPHPRPAPPSPPPPPPPPPRHRQPHPNPTTAPGSSARRAHPTRNQPEFLPLSALSRGTTWDSFFLESLPSPPRHGSSAQDGVDWGSATTDPGAAMLDPPRSYAEAVCAGRSGADGPRLRRSPPFTPHLRPATSCNSRRRPPTAAFTPPRRSLQGERINSGKMDPKEYFNGHRRVADAAEEQGWQPAKGHRKRPSRPALTRPCRGDGGRDWPSLHRHGTRHHSRRPTTSSLDAFKRVTEGRCFICLARDHRAASCRDPFRDTSRRSGSFSKPRQARAPPAPTATKKLHLRRPLLLR
ncbi:unnamed protein product [Urochloa humidicola]